VPRVLEALFAVGGAASKARSVDRGNERSVDAGCMLCDEPVVGKIPGNILEG